jgi:hypothetical protein
MYDEDRTSFFVAVSPFFGVTATVAAQMAYQHMAHHIRLGFRCADLHRGSRHLPKLSLE